MKAAIYCRVSTDEQREAGSINTQRDFARRYCELHEVEVYDWYADDGVSGAVPVSKRPDGARLLADAQAGKFQKVLFYRLDRMARSVLELLRCHETLEGYGVPIASMSEPFDTSTPVGKFVMTMLGSIAQLEKDTITERSTLGSLRVAHEGRWLGGKPPFGYTVAGGRLQVKPGEADFVREVFRLYVEERLGSHQIAELFNARGVPLTAQAKGDVRELKGHWHPSAVCYILKNETYAGRHTYRKTQVRKQDGQRITNDRRPAGEHIVRDVPAIIDEDTWNEAQRLRLYNARSAKRNARNNYLLKGLIKCGKCARTYIADGRICNGGRFYYRCASQVSGPSCHSPRIRGDLLEEAIWTDIEEFVRHPEKVLPQLEASLSAQVRAQAPLEHEAGEVERALAGKAQERARVINSMRRGVISEAEAEDELGSLQGEIATLQARMDGLFNRQRTMQDAQNQLIGADQLLRGLEDRLEGADFQSKRPVMELLVASIVVAEGQNEAGKRVPRADISYTFEQPLKSEKYQLGVGRAAIEQRVDYEQREREHRRSNASNRREPPEYNDA